MNNCVFICKHDQLVGSDLTIEPTLFYFILLFSTVAHVVTWRGRPHYCHLLMKRFGVILFVVVYCITLDIFFFFDEQ